MNVARQGYVRMLEGSLDDGLLGAMYFRFGSQAANVDMVRSMTLCMDVLKKQLHTKTQPQFQHTCSYIMNGFV